MIERIGFEQPPKKLIYGLLGLLLLYAIVRSLVAAAGKAFWYDELLTLTVSSLGSWKATLEAVGRLDGQPPLFYAIEKFALGLGRKQEIALRLPSLLAFPCTLACVFIYVKKRGGEIVAFLCALFLLITTLFQTYAVEARPYSMAVACIAFALVCYQRVPSPLWTVLLAISLALAQSLHYLAVLAMVPFGLAEAVHFLETRKFRWPVWAALVVGALPLLLFWKFLAIHKAIYGAHFWAHLEFSLIPHTYGELLQTSSQLGAGIAAVALAGVLGTAFSLRAVKTTGPEERNKDLAEAVLLFAFVALPFAAYLLTRVVHIGLAARYVLAMVLGVSVALGYILSRANYRTVCFFAVFVLSVVGVQELHFWRFAGSHMREVNSAGIAAEMFIESAGHRELPVVVPQNMTFILLAHYASPSSAGRFVYLAQDPAPNDKNWSDTADKGIQLLQSHWPIRVSNFREFTSAHKEFLVYLEEKDPGRDPMTPRLVREGWTLQTVALDDFQRVYLVTGDGSSARQ